MSCGEPHETDCSEVLAHLYEYLDREMPDKDSAKFREHMDECSPCLEKYGLEQEVKKLVKRCCGHDEVPSDLRDKVMGRIRMIKGGEVRDAGRPAEPSPGLAALAEEDAGTRPGSPPPSSPRDAAPSGRSTPSTHKKYA